MLSRVADSIYWMNRYMERAENYARFILVNFNLELDMPPDMEEQWKPLLQTTLDLPGFESKYDDYNKRDVIHYLAFDLDNPNSIISSLKLARENARTVRENISLEMWEQINRIYLLVNEPHIENNQDQEDDPRDFFREIILGCQLFYGISESTVSHTEGWHFGRIGRFLERADKTSRILDVKYHLLLPSAKRVGSSIDLLQWVALLKSNSAYSMCRRHYGLISPDNVLEFLILNRDFPRSIFFCLRHAQISLNKLSTSPADNYNESQKLIGSVCSKLEYITVDEIILDGTHEFLDKLQMKINHVSETIFDTFIAIKD